MKPSLIPLALILSSYFPQSACAQTTPTPSTDTTAKPTERRIRNVFDFKQPVILQEDFRAANFDRWNFSEDDRYQIPRETPERIQIVDAPGSTTGAKAVRFVVPRAPNSFRSEISLHHETGFNERWYGGRILIPQEWEFDSAKGVDIVMQWHGIPGNWRATYPNLEISVGNQNWFIRQSFGSPQTKPTRTNLKLDSPVERGKRVSWVIHAKWSPREDGLLEIWKDGKQVMKRTGPNVYGTISVDYTPYLKTGIYHPEWKVQDDAQREKFNNLPATVNRKIVYVTDLKIGDERAKFDDVAPRGTTP